MRGSQDRSVRFLTAKCEAAIISKLKVTYKTNWYLIFSLLPETQVILQVVELVKEEIRIEVKAKGVRGTNDFLIQVF